MTHRITSNFGFESTAMEVVEGINLVGKRAIVTGGASGIGIETVRALVKAGAEVTIAARDTKRAAQVASEINASVGGKRVRVAELDLANWDSIDNFIDQWNVPLDILINNAGVMAIPTLELSPQGHEMQFATNHLGHFRLSLGLHDSLKKADNARIVSLSSRGHLRSDIDFDDIDFRSRPYDPRIAYGQSKTANALFAVEATRRWSKDGITANAVHPGAIADTNLSRYADPVEYKKLINSGIYTFKTPEQGAATSVFVATSPLLQGIGGLYFENNNEAVIDNPQASGKDGAGVAAYALDQSNARRLWDVSLDMMDRQNNK